MCRNQSIPKLGDMFFEVREGIFLGHMVLQKGLQVYKENIEVIGNLPTPISIKGIRSFMGHAGVYPR